MKRLFFIFLIIAVLAVVAYYTLMEFSVPEITYVKDNVYTSTRGNEMILNRLYTSGVDIDAFTEMVESSSINTEFTEEEIWQAALESGAPEFYPTFYFYMYYPDPKTGTFNFNGVIRQEFAENQKNANFDLKNMYLEIFTDGMQIENFETTLIDKESGVNNAPVISEDKRSLAISLENVLAYGFDLRGTGGTVTFQFTYDIITNTIFPSEALSDQLLMLYAKVSVDEDAVLYVEYISEPYSSLEDMEY